MSNIKGHFKLYDESPVFQLIVSLLILAAAGGLLSIISEAGLNLLSGLGTAVLKKDVTVLTPQEISYMRTLFILQKITLFIIPSLIILRLLSTVRVFQIEVLRKPHISDVILIIILALSLFPVIGFLSQLNASMHLPKVFSSVEKWMITEEEHAGDLINIYAASGNLRQMMISLLGVAVLPAIGEELLFRGVIQKIFYGFFSSRHIGIWLTAALFSAFHFQFFGFLPRFLLGLVYGYLFLWSRNIWLPVLAHFVNNALPVVLYFLKGESFMGSTNDIALWKIAMALPIPVIICVVIMVYIRSHGKENKIDGSGA